MVRLLCFCLFVCLLAPIGVAGSAAPGDLRPTFTDGGERRFRVESESVITRAVPALDERISQTTRLTYFLTRQISMNADGNPSAKLRFDRIRFKTQAPNLLGELEDVEYDTGLWDPEAQQVKGRTQRFSTRSSAERSRSSSQNSDRSNRFVSHRKSAMPTLSV